MESSTSIARRYHMGKRVILVREVNDIRFSRWVTIRDNLDSAS